MEEKAKIPTEVYSRVVGFLRPVHLWNIGKKAEWKDRKTYKLSIAMRRIEDGKLGRHQGIQGSLSD
jgi:hypothetical protein